MSNQFLCKNKKDNIKGFNFFIFFQAGTHYLIEVEEEGISLGNFSKVKLF